jgi:hypothetical protein
MVKGQRPPLIQRRPAAGTPAPPLQDMPLAASRHHTRLPSATMSVTSMGCSSRSLARSGSQCLNSAAQFGDSTSSRSVSTTPGFSNCRRSTSKHLRDIDTGVQLALWQFVVGSIRGPRLEGREWLECARAHTPAHAAPAMRNPTRARVLVALMGFRLRMGEVSAAEALIRGAVAICREQGDRYDLMIALWRFSELGHVSAAEHQAAVEQWLTLARELRERLRLAYRHGHWPAVVSILALLADVAAQGDQPARLACCLTLGLYSRQRGSGQPSGHTTGSQSMLL